MMNYSRPSINNGTGGNNNPRTVNPAYRPSNNNSYSRPGYNANPGTTPNNGNNSYQRAARPSVYTDRQGNIYQRADPNSSWQQRQNRAWSPVNNTRPEVQNLDRQQLDRSRGEMRSQNFQRIPSSPSSGGFRPAPSGGGGFRPSPSGGGSGGGSRSSSGGGGSRPGGGGRGR